VNIDPGFISLLVLLAGLYVRAVGILARRGYRVPRRQQAFWWAGVALIAIGLLSPIDRWADDLLSAHMVQHMLLADLACPLLLAGLRTPVGLFLAPRPVLVALARRRWLRALGRTLTHPLVALPVYLVVLYAWHLTFAFEGALRHPVLHAAQHASFVTIGFMVWWPALEPNRRQLRGELWKIGHIVTVRLIAMFIGMAFIFTQTPIYSAYYHERAHRHGLSPIGDQRLGGGIMMSVDILIIIAALGFFFWRAATDADEADRREDAAREVAAAGV